MANFVGYRIDNSSSKLENFDLLFIERLSFIYETVFEAKRIYCTRLYILQTWYTIDRP